MKNLFAKTQLFARRYIPNETQIFGPSGVGKSTFFEQIQHRQNNPIVDKKTSTVDKRHCRDEITEIEFILCDTPGDDFFRDDWSDLIKEGSPLGIIFIVDHESTEPGIGALKYLYGVVKKHKQRHPEKSVTKGILLYINKYDLWQSKIDPTNLYCNYEDLLAKFKRLDIIPIVRWGSAKQYLDFPCHFDQALKDFYNLIFIPGFTSNIYPELDSVYLEESDG
jgi:signal recognition particle receptor subunit beta